MSFIFLLGMAGSGKSTLTATFGDWLERRGESIARVNLDPGVIRLPYNPDWDIRKYVDLRKIMVEEGLGPNGGLIRAHELMMKYVDKISLSIKSLAFKSSYILVDTPGQMELFAFREIGSALLSRLSNYSSLGIFIVDATNINKASDAVMALLLALAINFHLDIETIFIVNKIDASPNGKAVEYIETLLKDPKYLAKMIKEEGSGMLGEMAYRLVESLREFLPPTRIVAISATQGYNFYDLYSIIHDVFVVAGI